MNHDKLKGEWIDLSAPWIKEMREGRNANRIGLLDDPMLEACGKINGLSVLDSGCGEGRFCRKLLEQGAQYVLGIDLCAPMIKAAQKLQTSQDDYRLADAQDLHFLEEESFDLAISYLNQCDLPDFESNNREVFRVLKKGSRFVIANLHPMRSAVGNWKKDVFGHKKHVILDNYFDEGARYWKMMGNELTNFHRTLSTYIRSFLKNGFSIEDIIEPTVTQENLQKYPELDDELRVPNFIIYVLRKN